jgi:hypothetical protein
VVIEEAEERSQGAEGEGEARERVARDVIAAVLMASLLCAKGEIFRHTAQPYQHSFITDGTKSPRRLCVLEGQQSEQANETMLC